ERETQARDDRAAGEDRQERGRDQEQTDANHRKDPREDHRARDGGEGNGGALRAGLQRPDEDVL
ncbi:hypothetical protein C4T87_20195, partial [Clostridioides difficile]